MVHNVFNELSMEYGDIYTLWMGRHPTVMLNGDAITDAFVSKKNDFMGRPEFFFRTIIIPNQSSADIVFEDWGRAWEVLRRVAHSAARKFAVSEKLPNIEAGVVDEVVNLIIKKEGIGKAFNPKDYIYVMVYSILASLAAGKSLSIEDAEFLALKQANDDTLELQSKLLVIELFPFLRFFGSYKSDWKKLNRAVSVSINWCQKQIDDHLHKYSKMTDAKNNNHDAPVSDFCDALIRAKMEAEDEDRDAANYLTPENLKNVLLNLFMAGTETTRMTLNWAFLAIANYPEVQEKLRSEIESVIGSDIPTDEHRKRCHYVQAFIAEIMRFSPIVGAGVPHRAITDSVIYGKDMDGKVKGHKVPKGTTIIGNVMSQLFNENVWKDPRTFRPERFLENSSGAFNARVNDSFHPFSVGRRACSGEKLALINLFIEIARFLQKTKGFKIVLKDGAGSVSMEADPEQPTQYANVEHEIMIVVDSDEN